jgi:hypothetical protein
VYYSLTMTSTVTVASNDVYFVTGADSTAAGLALGTPPTTATFSGLKAYPDATTTYAEAAKVHNDAASGSSNVRLRPVSLTGDAADFEFVNFMLMDGTTVKATLSYTSDGVSWTLPTTTSWSAINGQAEWSVKVETKAANGATSGSVDIVIAIDVQ